MYAIRSYYVQMYRQIARLADDPHHHAAVVARPDRPVGRQRIGLVALVAVDRRRGERRSRATVREQSADIMPSDIGEDRITSYNVCYTKLLRDPPLPGISNTR